MDDKRRASGSAVSSGGWHPALSNGGAASRHMAIQRGGTASDLPGDLGGRQGGSPGGVTLVSLGHQAFQVTAGKTSVAQVRSTVPPF